MGIWDIFKKRNLEFQALDYEELDKLFEMTYLKVLAIDKCAEFLARIFSTSKFVFKKNNKILQNQWSYLFNTRPNKNESSSQFWKHFIYKLLTKNEVLVVITEDNQLLIADSYLKKEYAIFDNSFESVVVKNYQFKRSFKMEDVIFVKYNNNQLDRYLDKLFEDYEKLYDRVSEAILRNGQIRGVLKINGVTQFSTEELQRMKNYQEKLFKAFKEKSVAIAPFNKYLEYNELSSNNKQSNTSVDELKKLRRQFEDDVAGILGIPTAILHGEIADLESSKDALRRFCLLSLNKLIEDELISKILSKKEVEEGTTIRVVSLALNDIFGLATSIDKLISSGAMSRNEIRDELNYPSIEGGDEFVITKNYESTTMKGGEENEEN